MNRIALALKSPHFTRSSVSIVVQCLAVGFLCNACSHEAIVPEAKNVTVQREPVNKKCTEIGKVQGSVMTTTGTVEQAIEDMKLDAARKGANYVHMESTGAMGTSVSGIAYHCP